MANLEKTLPNIVQEALQKEDKVTRILASTLLRQLYIRPNTEKLNQKEYEVLRYEFINQINNPPYLYIIEKI